MTVLAALSLALWIYLLLGHGGFWRLGPMLGGEGAPAATPVAIVVPARNEIEHVERALRSLLAQSYGGPFRIVLVDDLSEDGTGHAARALRHPRLTVIDGAPRPEGWSGKLWAVSQGIDATTEPLLLLTDADIVHEPDHLQALAAKLDQGYDLVSEMVRLDCSGLAARFLVPAFVYFFALLYPFADVRDGGSRIAAAAGGVVLLRRSALTRIGGIAALRGALIDDVTLASHIKPGGRIWLSHSRLARSERAYEHVGEIWRMISRTAFVQLRYSWLMLALAIAGLSLVFLVPVVAVIAGDWRARLAGLLAWGLMSLSFAPSLRHAGQSRWLAPALPLIATFYMAASFGSAINHATGQGVVWKARRYG